MSGDVAYRYTGKNPMLAHHSGIPARDLSDEDVKALDAEQRKTLRGSAIYEKADTSPQQGKPATAEKEEPKK